MTFVVSVTGPPRAGVTAMADELRRRMPSYRFVEGDTQEPAAVVFVVSAVAPVIESDCAIAELAAAQTGVVIAVVSKIDDHRDWRQVLDANRERLAHLTWVGAAAAPRLGKPHIDELVGLLQAQLRDPAVAERNKLRAWESRICELRDRRDQLVRRRRLAERERVAALRGTVQQARVSLTHVARQRCAALRSELLDAAAAACRSEIAGFPERVRLRCDDALAALDEDIVAYTGDMAAGLPDSAAAIRVADPPLTSRRLETQLMTVLGAGFGLGVALVVTRFLIGLAPGLAAAGLVVGGAVGVATTAWVIRARTLLHDRAVLQGWVGDAAGAVRAAADERVATRMLAVEVALASATALGGAAEDDDIARRITAVDAEIRELAHARKRRSGH